MNLQNNIRTLRPGQNSNEKRAYDRMDGEKAMWYQRFRLYCQLGRQRSVQAVLAMEQGHLKAPDSTNILDQEARFSVDHQMKELSESGVKIVVSGTWKKQCVEFDWVARAEEWDLDQRKEWEKRLDKTIRLEAEFTSAQCRIWQLNTYAVFLQGMTTDVSFKEVPFKERIDAIRLSQSLMKDIKQEMDALDRLGNR